MDQLTKVQVKTPVGVRILLGVALGLLFISSGFAAAVIGGQLGSNISGTSSGVIPPATNINVNTGSIGIEAPGTTPTDTGSTSGMVAPYFTPVPGTYNFSQTIIILSRNPGEIMHYYTTDGTIPTCYVGSGLNTTRLFNPASPIRVERTTTIIAIACYGGIRSGYTAGVYIIQPNAPTFTPAPGNYNTTQTVTMVSSNPGSIMHYYTTDRTVPTCYVGSGLNTTRLFNPASPIRLERTTRINAVACYGDVASVTVGGDYNIR